MITQTASPLDLTETKGQGVLEGGLNNSKGSENKVDKQIEISIPEGTTIDTTPYLPTWGISHLEDYIDHITEVARCPRSYVVCSVMSAISTAAGTNFMCSDGVYKNNPMFFIAIVGHQSKNKSAPMEWALEPITELNMELIEAYNNELATCNEGDKKPKKKRLVVQDVTPEVLNVLMSENEHGLCLFSDELALKFGTMDRYHNGSGIANELSIFSNKFISEERLSRDGSYIARPYLNQLGSIQPSRLVDFFGNKEWISNGYNSRWLFDFPDKEKYIRLPKVVINSTITSQYNRHIKEIYNKGISYKGRIIQFTDEALTLLEDYEHQQALKADSTDDEYEIGIYSKLNIQLHRWALAVYVTKLFSVDIGTKIDASIVKYSIECMRYFESMALKVKNHIEREKEGKKRPTAKAVSKESIIKDICSIKPNFNRTALAKVLECSQPYVSKTAGDIAS